MNGIHNKANVSRTVEPISASFTNLHTHTHTKEKTLKNK